jgi:endonuclease/exonuclease/phosphatase family metal-dependent hydrolase
MKRLAIFLVSGLGLGLLGCTDDDETAPPMNALSVVTYNGGIAVGFVPGAEQRLPLTSEAVAGLTADLVCVQEFWKPEHVTELETTVAAAFPHTMFLDPEPGTTGPASCTVTNLEDLQTCLSDNGCDLVCGDELVTCALTKCGPELSALPVDCYACIQANIGKPIDEILGTCTTESTEYVYGGAYGIGFLSSVPLEDQDSQVFESTTNGRAVLYAKVTTEIGEVHAFCTHLNAIFTDIDYPKPTGSWEEEQTQQIADLRAFIESKAGADGQVVLMGDMNCGPAGPNFVADTESSYQLLAGGLTNPYADNPNSRCTFCDDNPLTGSDHDDSVAIDHILLGNVAGSVSSARILDDPVTVNYCSADNEVRYSDHYGVKVTIEQPK